MFPLFVNTINFGMMVPYHRNECTLPVFCVSWTFIRRLEEEEDDEDNDLPLEALEHEFHEMKVKVRNDFNFHPRSLKLDNNVSN